MINGIQTALDKPSWEREKGKVKREKLKVIESLKTCQANGMVSGPIT